MVLVPERMGLVQLMTHTECLPIKGHACVEVKFIKLVCFREVTKMFSYTHILSLRVKISLPVSALLFKQMEAGIFTGAYTYKHEYIFLEIG